MLPIFPDFKVLEITDKSSISELTNNHKPYSDFGFTSLFSWDTAQDIEISSLNDNLVIKFSDYVDKSATKFLTFIGNNRVDETARELLEFAKSNNLASSLQLVPQTVVDNLKHPEEFIIDEDRDNFDYILAAEDQAELPGKQHAKRRYVLNKFQNTHGKNVKVLQLDTSDASVQKQILDIFEKWEKSMGKDRTETENELKAIKRVLEHSSHLDIQTLGVYINDALAGFSIFEIVQNDHGVIHFEKADVSYKGIFQFLKYIAANDLQSKKQKYINIEQDLGLLGLRESKMTHHPVHFLKKYTIHLKK